MLHLKPHWRVLECKFIDWETTKNWIDETFDFNKFQIAGNKFWFVQIKIVIKNAKKNSESLSSMNCLKQKRKH